MNYPIGQDYPKTATAPVSPYEAHQQAVNEWFEACKAFQMASERRAAAEKGIEQACQMLHEHVEQTRHDPTCPPPPQPANGLVGNYNLGPR